VQNKFALTKTTTIAGGNEFFQQLSKIESKIMKKLQITILTITMAAAISARADVTISGTDLSSLHYSGASGDAQYVSGSPDYAQLTTPDAGLLGDSPAVFVRASNPLATSSFSTLNALAASYVLDSYSGGSGNQPYWITYLYDPYSTDGGLIGVISFSGPDLNGSSQIHVFYGFDDSGVSSDTYNGDTLSQLDSIAYGGTTFGQLEVYETGVEIGDWAISDSIGATADIESITISSVPEPTTIISGALLLLPLGVSTIRRLRKQRAVA
jgi:hypothetical protein